MDKYKLIPYIRLQHEMTSARWDEGNAKWNVTIRSGSEGREFTDTADILFLGVGGLSRWRWPDIDGLNSFGGTLVHSAQWNVSDETMDQSWKEKNVAVIGNVCQRIAVILFLLCSLYIKGSSGIQIVTALQPRAKTLTSFIRAKSWVLPGLGVDMMLKATGKEPDSDDCT